MTETNFVLLHIKSNVPDSSPVFSFYIGVDAIKKNVLKRISPEEEKQCSVHTQMHKQLEIIISLCADN